MFSLLRYFSITSLIVFGVITILLGLIYRLYTILFFIINHSTTILPGRYDKHHQVEQALRESEEKFRTLAETTTAAIVIHQGAEFLYVNPATEAITGYSKAELLAMKFWTIVDPVHHDMIRTRAAARLQGTQPPAQFELKMLPKDGRDCWVYLAAGVIEFEGNPAVIATFFDITRLKQSEESLALARDEALAASRLKTQLLANVSHELRTPLNAILGYAEMLQGDVFGPLSASQSEAATEIIDSTGQLLNFVNNLLGQAQIEAGKIALNMAWFAPAELLDETSVVIGALAQTKGVKLLYNITPDMPAKLYGDPYWLRQILLNLVNNAVKFTEQGRVTVGICRPDPDHWCIRVTDTGYGIPLEAQAYIFEAFRQMDGTVTRTHGGSGLGLSIVKQLTTLMGGQIFLESEVGQGSTFTILLPLTVAQKEPLVKSNQ